MPPARGRRARLQSSMRIRAPTVVGCSRLGLPRAPPSRRDDIDDFLRRPETAPHTSLCCDRVHGAGRDKIDEGLDDLGSGFFSNWLRAAPGGSRAAPLRCYTASAGDSPEASETVLKACAEGLEHVPQPALPQTLIVADGLGRVHAGGAYFVSSRRRALRRPMRS